MYRSHIIVSHATERCQDPGLTAGHTLSHAVLQQLAAQHTGELVRSPAERASSLPRSLSPCHNSCSARPGRGPR